MKGRPFEICIWVSLQGSDHAVALTAHGRVFTWGQLFSRICSFVLHIKPLSNHQSHVISWIKGWKLAPASGLVLDHCTATSQLKSCCMFCLRMCIIMYVFVPCCANLPALQAGTERFQRRNIAQPLCVEGPLRGLKISKVQMQSLVIACGNVASARATSVFALQALQVAAGRISSVAAIQDVGNLKRFTLICSDCMRLPITQPLRPKHFWAGIWWSC